MQQAPRVQLGTICTCGSNPIVEAVLLITCGRNLQPALAEAKKPPAVPSGQIPPPSWLVAIMACASRGRRAQDPTSPHLMDGTRAHPEVKFRGRLRKQSRARLSGTDCGSVAKTWDKRYVEVTDASLEPRRPCTASIGFHKDKACRGQPSKLVSLRGATLHVMPSSVMLVCPQPWYNNTSMQHPSGAPQ